MLSLFRYWKAIAVVLAVATFVGSGYIAYSFVVGLTERNAEQARRIGQAETAIETQRASLNVQAALIADYKAQTAETARRLQEVADVQRKANKERERLLRTFASNDFERLVNERPEAIERLVNDGTARAMRLLECASGAARADCADGDSGEALAPTVTETGTD